MRARPRVSTAVRLAGLVLAVTPALAGPAVPTRPAVVPTVEGYWKGTIGVASDKAVQIMIDVVKKDAGWRATFYAPAQGIHAVELTGVEIAGRSVRFRIPQAEGDPTFRGELAGNGQSLSGSFDSAGETLPFQLDREARPKDLAVDIYAEYRNPGLPGVGLEGTWRGLLMTGPNRMRLALDVRRGRIDPSGQSVDGLGGSLTSLDQGGASHPVDSFELKGNAVQFEMLDIGALYKGTMKPDGAEFFGVWIQNGTEFPLTFRRTSQEPGASPPG